MAFCVFFFPLPYVHTDMVYNQTSTVLSSGVLSAQSSGKAGREVRCRAGCGVAPLRYQQLKKVNPPGLFLAVKCSKVSQHARGSLEVHFYAGLSYLQDLVHQLFQLAKTNFLRGSSLPVI